MSVEIKYNYPDTAAEVGGGDPRNPYFYLAGAMSNLPQFNVPAFMAAAGVLREAGYNIINPAELEHERDRAAILASEDGAHGTGGVPAWVDCLRRDMLVVAHENCEGIIAIPGWEQSGGARLETYINSRFGRPLYLLEAGNFEDGEFRLTLIDRDQALRAAGVVDG